MAEPNTVPIKTNGTNEEAFSEVVRLIEASRGRAIQAVNTTLIELYWQIGETISRKIEAAVWGDGIVQQLADYLARTQPGLRGFTRRNLFRMTQFYEAYRGEAIVSSLLTHLPWTHHLIILGHSKRPEEREFYLKRAIDQRWSSRQLERQFKTALFERSVVTPARVSPPVRQIESGVAPLAETVR
jgi:predicted nuclease of restriction endonuclease-like (RecB) superfamily